MMKKAMAALLMLAMLCAAAGSAAAVTMSDHVHAVCGVEGCTNLAHNHSGEQEYLPISMGGENTVHTNVGYYLAKNIDGGLKFVGNGDVTVYLCLNGCTIAANENTVAVSVSGCDLVLCDCNGSGNDKGVITHGTHMHGNPPILMPYTGGGVSVSDGNMTMYGGTISGNWGAHSGGGVFVPNGNMTMYGGTISGNIADSDGGGVYAGKDMTMKGGEISDNTSTNGGGVYTGKGMTMKGGEISGNTTTGDGGGVYSKGNVTVSGTAKISGNTTTGDGGGVYMGLSSSMEMTGGTISGNTANGDGGGVYLYARNAMTMNGGEISGNTAMYGGGVYAKSSGVMTMKGGEISGNTARGDYAYGGGVHMGSSSRMEMTGGTISGNEAQGEYSSGGGGVSMSSMSSMTMNGGKISGNNAGMIGDGGGVYSQGNVTVSGGEISGNKAGMFGVGGGMCVDSGTANSVTIAENALIKNNEASSGGGMYAGCSVTMHGGTIEGNKANGGGGGVYAKKDMTMTGGRITGNKLSGAIGCGGGVYAIDIMTMTGGEISGNKSLGSEVSGGEMIEITMGGGVYAKNGMEMTDGRITGNAAELGGGVYLHYNERGGGYALRLMNTALADGYQGMGISGKPNIAGNKDKNGAESNVYLKGSLKTDDAAMLILNGALEDGAKIGVTTEKEPEMGKPVVYMVAGDKTISNSDVEKTFSDKTHMTMKASDGEAVLHVPGDPIVSVPVANLPKTGDASMLGAWLALLGASAAGMKMRRKK